MQKTQEQIRYEMSVAYFNVLRNKENELINQLKVVRDELVICAKALDDYKTIAVEQPEENVEEWPLKKE